MNSTFLHEALKEFVDLEHRMQSLLSVSFIQVVFPEKKLDKLNIELFCSIQPAGMEVNKMREEMVGPGETERQTQTGHDQSPPYSHPEQSDKQKKGESWQC